MTEETPRVAGLVPADVPAAMSAAGLLAVSLTLGKSGMPTKAPWTNLPLLP